MHTALSRVGKSGMGRHRALHLLLETSSFDPFAVRIAALLCFAPVQRPALCGAKNRVKVNSHACQRRGGEPASVACILYILYCTRSIFVFMLLQCNMICTQSRMHLARIQFVRNETIAEIITWHVIYVCGARASDDSLHSKWRSTRKKHKKLRIASCWW